MKKAIIVWLQKLGIEIANEAEDGVVQGALEKAGEMMQTRTTMENEKTELGKKVTQLEGELATEKTKLATLTTERDGARTEFQNERKARIALVLDQAQASGKFTEAQRPQWAGKFEAEFANALQELGKITPVVKTTARTAQAGGRKVEIANVRERSEKVQELVSAAMKGGLSYDAAFLKVQRDHAGLFEQMSKPEFKH